MRDLGSVWDFSVTNYHEGSIYNYIAFKHSSFDFLCVNDKKSYKMNFLNLYDPSLEFVCKIS